MVRAKFTRHSGNAVHAFDLSPIDVQIIFTEDDFRVNERNMTNPDSASLMPVRISKNSRIANPIVLDVIPLTVMDARNRPPFLPNNVPDNNTFSPPYASKLLSLDYQQLFTFPLLYSYA